jgi:post-segregation antitoxin (ccd killing protein)
VEIAVTLTEFSKLFGTLARQLRADVDTETCRDYHAALKDLPLDAVRMAQEALSRETGRKWLPTAPEWRTEALKARSEAIRATLAPDRSEPWRYECAACLDTCWEQGLGCDGTAHCPCGRRRPHAANAFTKRCTCYPGNRTWQRHQQLGWGA